MMHLRAFGTIARITAVLALAALVMFPVAALAQGSLISWGNPGNGLVSGTPAGTYTAVSAGAFHTVAIRMDGTLVSWGYNSDGQLTGTPSTGTYSAVSAGAAHTVALRTDGTLISWGFDALGQVSGTPATGTFSAVAAGTYHSVAIRTDGTLVSWGHNGNGQVTGTPAGTYSAVSAGSLYSVAIRTDGTLVSWGSDNEGEVTGTPATGTYSAVSAGDFHSVAIRTDGTIVSWGYDGNGQVSGTPVTGTYSAVSAGGAHSVALRTDGTIVSWGYNGFGQVTGTPAVGTYSAVSAGGNHSVAIRSANRPPVADAGPDQNVSCTGASTSVTLLGSGSSDPDGDALSFTWYEGTTQIANGVNPTVSLSHAGHTLMLVVTDPSGASSSDTVVINVVDTTAPVISGVPADINVTATSVSGAVVTFSTPTASDLCDGPVLVTCTPSSGSQFPLGATTVSCTATDGSNNMATATFKVIVTYSWSGVLQPINANGSSVFKAGSTVPVKFELTGASAGIANAVATLSYVQLTDSDPGPVTEAVSTAAATTGNLFRYDASSGQYVFNWSTKGLTIGKYRLYIDLGDGINRTVDLGLK